MQRQAVYRSNNRLNRSNSRLKPFRDALALCVLLGGLTASSLSASGFDSTKSDKGGPSLKLTLESLGIPGLSASFLDIGASMFTLHLLDDTHLMVTYSKRGLVPRIADDPKDDDDRIVAAALIELPTGKIVARTEWRTHDHARYLWALGHGRFLLRIRDSLSAFAPLANLHAADPFARVVFPNRGGRPAAIFSSEDGGLLTVETEVAAPNRIDVSSNGQQRPHTTTVIDFYRILATPDSFPGFSFERVGVLHAGEPFLVPIDSDGYLWPVEVANNKWQITFDDMRGKTARLGALESSCTPRLELVSPSEYIALTCRGSGDNVRMASFGLDGQETWQEDFGEFGTPVLLAAPSAGRFAITHAISAGSATPAVPGAFGGNGAGQGAGQGAIQGTPARQEIRVYQTVSGDLLLKVDASPVFKTAQNFDLTEDGKLLAVLKDGAVQIFKLPELSKRDRESIAEVASFAPPHGSGPVLLKLLASELPAAEPAKPSSASAAPSLTDPPDKPADRSAAAAASAPRRPPTLLNPGEKPEFGVSNARPQ